MATQFKTIISLVTIILLLAELSIAYPVVPRPGNVEGKPIQIYKVKYGTSYLEKWRPVMDRNRDNFLSFAQGMIKTIRRSVPEFFLYYMDNYSTSYPYHPEMMQELEAISILSGLQFSDVFLLNIVTEIFSHEDACTSIIVRNDKGRIFHGRNLDYFMTSAFSIMAIQFDYYDQNGVLTHSASQFAGYIIVHAGIRYGQYSVSLNERDHGTPSQNLIQFMKGAYPVEYLMTEMLHTKKTFAEAKQALMEEQVMSACYYILAGNSGNEGVIIERNGDSIHKMYELDEKKWFLVATNVDQEDKDTDTRRDSASKKIENMGPSMTQDDLYSKVMTQYPNFNIITIETCMMNPETDFFNCTRWY